MSEWISVKERLPENGEYQVLFWSEQTDNYEILDVCDALSAYDCGVDYQGNTIMSENPLYVDFEYTYWQLLPAPPKEYL